MDGEFINILMEPYTKESLWIMSKMGLVRLDIRVEIIMKGRLRKDYLMEEESIFIMEWGWSMLESG